MKHDTDVVLTEDVNIQLKNEGKTAYSPPVLHKLSDISKTAGPSNKDAAGDVNTPFGDTGS